VLVIGKAGAGKTLLFRALAGLWPWGAGRIERPHGQTLYCVPRTPYLPPGTLREVLAYPTQVGRIEAEVYRHALDRLGLERLVPLLDASRRWDRDLSEDEQQAIAFARLLLHAPRWVVIDGALDSLDAQTRERVLRLFSEDLAGSGLLYIGRSDPQRGFFSHVLHLINDPQTRRLARHRAAEPRSRPLYRPPAPAT
jgi:putative ATP-binding cassette transporter